MWNECKCRNPEEVGHGHVIYVRKRIHAVSLWTFLYRKNDQNFLGSFFDYPKGIGSIRKRYWSRIRISHQTRSTAWSFWLRERAESYRSGLNDRSQPGKHSARAYVLRCCIQPSAPCRDVDHRAGFKVLGTLARFLVLGAVFTKIRKNRNTQLAIN